MSDHGFDLEAVMRKQGSHSCFAPSASAMWLNCLGSLIPNLLAEDNAGEDAAYGTVAHGVAETWLKTDVRPSYLIGEIEQVDEGHAVFDIEIDAVMLDYVEEYVDWCNFLPGAGKHHVEVRVDFSRLTPIPNQGGTADHIYCEPGVLTITDLKMGIAVQVFAYKNTQAMLYALGAFYRWDDEYHFERIIIRIAQPRLGHFDVWETTREELLAFADFVKVRAALAWKPNAPRTPGEKQCQWCKVKDTCAAFAVRAIELTEGYFDDLDAAVEDESIIRLVDRLDDPFEDFSIKPVNVAQLSTQQLAALLPWRKAVENWWKRLEDELESRLESGQAVPGQKLVEGRSNRAFYKPSMMPSTMELLTGVPEEQFIKKAPVSPNQAEEILQKAGYSKREISAMLKAHVFKPQGKPVMAPMHDKRPEITSAADECFEDLDAAEGL